MGGVKAHNLAVVGFKIGISSVREKVGDCNELVCLDSRLAEGEEGCRERTNGVEVADVETLLGEVSLVCRTHYYRVPGHLLNETEFLLQEVIGIDQGRVNLGVMGIGNYRREGFARIDAFAADDTVNAVPLEDFLVHWEPKCVFCWFYRWSEGRVKVWK